MQKIDLVSSEVNLGRFFDHEWDLTTEKNNTILNRWLKWIERLALSCNKNDSGSTSIGNEIRKTNAVIETAWNEWKGWSIFHKRLVSCSWQLDQLDQNLSLSLLWPDIFVSCMRDVHSKYRRWNRQEEKFLCTVALYRSQMNYRSR